uniref:Secreted protein n=1 Tax=Steinernema glaseri TaxID=37863 RepID=A0A1I7ZER9_9BILA
MLLHLFMIQLIKVINENNNLLLVSSNCPLINHHYHTTISDCDSLFRTSIPLVFLEVYTVNQPRPLVVLIVHDLKTIFTS